MNFRRFRQMLKCLGVSAALLAFAVPATACASAALPTQAVVPSPTPTAYPVLEKPDPGVPGIPLVALPGDEASHNTPFEWWYVIGFVTDDSGNRYSYYFLDVEGMKTGVGAPHLVRAATGNLDTGEHHQEERIAIMRPGIGAPSVYVHSAGWVMTGDVSGNYKVTYDLEGLTLDLSIQSTKEAALHWEGTGLFDAGDLGWSYYYSYTRQDVSGYVEDEAGRRPVTGSGWYDHQWGDLTRIDFGWDWAAAQLDDGSDLMVTRLWDVRTGERVMLYGTFVSPEGKVRHLNEDEVSMESTRTWTSPETGVRYPVAWLLQSDPLDLNLEIIAMHDEAEFVAQISYWEGAVELSGTFGGKSVSGQGFGEMVGYDPRILESAGNPFLPLQQ